MVFEELRKPIKEYVYIDTSLEEYLEDKNIVYKDFIEREYSYLELVNIKSNSNINELEESSQLPIIDTMKDSI